MPNQLLTRQELTYKPLEILRNNTIFIPRTTRDYDQEFGRKGGKIGDTLYVRKPARAIGRDGAAYQPEGMIDTQVPITINQQSGVDFQFSTQEKYLSLDEMAERYLEPYMASLANKLDYRGIQMAVLNTANLVGTPGTTPGLNSTDAFYVWSTAGQKIDEMGFPLREPRTALLTPAMRVGWITYNKALFNDAPALGKQWKTGQVSNAIGYDWFVDQNANTQVIGALGGTPTSNGANQTGTSILTTGWTANVTNVLNAGDVISFAGVYAVNPQSRQSTGSLQQFVVQQNASSANDTTATLILYPAIVPSGQFQNVTNSPSVNALINVYGAAAAGQGALAGVSTPQGLVFVKSAYAFMSFPGDVPEGVDMGMEARDKETGISLRFVRDWIGATDQWINRYDVYYGSAPLYSEGGCRVCS